MGVEPGDQLVELNTKIAAGWHDAAQPAPDAPTRAHGNVRRAGTSLVGRDREVNDVIDAVRHHSLVTLLGVGGVGKTRLAVEVAIGFERPRDGAWIVELGQVEDEDDVAAAVAAKRSASESLPGWARWNPWCGGAGNASCSWCSTTANMSLDPRLRLRRR